MLAGRFIVGTGRCGSTLLSRMLSCHPDVLSLHEFFAGLDWGKRFQREPVGGDAFCELICAPNPILTMVLERGYRPVEVTYPFERHGARFSPTEPLPYLLAHTLPPLAADPDQVLDAVREFTVSLPRQSVAAHARALFAWLCNRNARAVWIERSAAAIVSIADLNAAHPGARFLHVHRQGEEAALSMREHPVFRLATMLTYGIPVGEGGELEHLAALGRDADHVSKLLATRAPAEYFGRWWSQQLTRGYRGLAALDAYQYREVRFEDLVAEPHALLAEIADFFELPDSSRDWRDAAATLVSPSIAARLPSLKADERDRLIEACRPGNELLGRT